MKARYNVVVQSDHIIIMQKLHVVWAKLSTEERLALHDRVAAKVQEMQDGVPEGALPAGETNGEESS